MTHNRSDPHALTDIAIKNAKPRAKLYKIADGGGLCLLVHPAGGKWWRYRYRFDDKERALALGSYPDVTLAEARERHYQARKVLSAGNDPMEVKQEAKRARLLKTETTFEVIAREWHTNNLHTWGKKHGMNVIKRLESDIFPKLGNRPITAISTPELLPRLIKSI